MKVSPNILLIGAVFQTASANNLRSLATSSGTCTYIDSFGSDLCEHGNNDSWLPDWLEAGVDQAACIGLADAGCVWDVARGKCAQDPANCIGADEGACNGLAAKGCFWKEAGACDPHDAMKCTATGTEFYECTHMAWSDLISEVLNKVDPFDPNTWNISSIISDFVDRMKNGCVSKYLECFFLTECGSPQLVVAGICEDTLLKICEELGTSSSNCPTAWCDVGVTQGSSLIEVVLDFADDLNLETFFDADRIDELKQTIEYIIGGKFNLDWIDFDKNTGKISITIPPNSIISQAELDDIIAKLTNMLTGNSGSSMSNGFAVQNVAVTSQLATIDSSQAAWEGKKAESEGMSTGTMVGIGAVCVGVVAAVVGGVMWGKSKGNGSSGPKQYGGKSAKKAGKGVMKGRMDMNQFV